jgi:hypothetical protein
MGKNLTGRAQRAHILRNSLTATLPSETLIARCQRVMNPTSCKVPRASRCLRLPFPKTGSPDQWDRGSQVSARGRPHPRGAGHLKVRCDHGKGVAQIRAGKLQSANRDNRNQRSDQAIFNGGGACLILDQLIYRTQNSHLNTSARRSSIRSISIKFFANQSQTMSLTLYMIVKDT